MMDFSETKRDESQSDFVDPSAINIFGDMSAEDLKQYKPDILFLYKDQENTQNLLYPEVSHNSISYYLRDHEAFQNEFSHYKKTDDEFVFSYALYPDNKEQHSITYAIYKRKKDSDDK